MLNASANPLPFLPDLPVHTRSARLLLTMTAIRNWPHGDAGGPTRAILPPVPPGRRADWARREEKFGWEGRGRDEGAGVFEQQQRPEDARVIGASGGHNTHTHHPHARTRHVIPRRQRGCTIAGDRVRGSRRRSRRRTGRIRRTPRAARQSAGDGLLYACSRGRDALQQHRRQACPLLQRANLVSTASLR